MVEQITLHGKSFVFVGDAERTDGAIATEYQYRHGLRPYAHLYRDGRILRLGQQIGSWEDIEWGESVEITPTPLAEVAVLNLTWAGGDDAVETNP